MELSFSMRPITAQSRLRVDSEMSLFSASDFCCRSQIDSKLLERDSSFGASALFKISLLKISGTRIGCLYLPRRWPQTVVVPAARFRTRVHCEARSSEYAQAVPCGVELSPTLAESRVKVSYEPVVFKKKLR